MQQSSHNTHSIISPGLLHCCCLLRFCQLKLLFFSWVVMIMCIHSIVFQFCKTQQWFTDQKLSRPYRLYNFWKLLVQGYWNWYYQMSHTQLNTVVRSWDNLTLGQLGIRIHKYCILPSARKTQQMAYFWKEDCWRVSKMIIPCVKRANTKVQIQNTQISKYSVWQSARKT